MHGFPPDDMPHREQHDYVDAANKHDQGAGQGKYSVMRWLLDADAPDLTAPPVQEAFQHPTGTGPSGNVADKKPCGNHGHQSPVGAHGADADGDAQEPFWLPHLRLSNLGLDNEQAHSPRVTASSQPGCHLQAVARTPAQLSNKQYPQQQGVSCSGADTPQKEASKLLATVGAVHMPAIARAAAHAKNNSQESGRQGAAQRSAVIPPHAHIVGQVYSQPPCSTHTDAAPAAAQPVHDVPCITSSFTTRQAAIPSSHRHVHPHPNSTFPFMLTKSSFIMGQSAFVSGSEPASLMQIFHTSSSCFPSLPPIDLDDLLQGEQQKLKAPELQQRLDQVMTQLCPSAAMVVTQGSGTVSPALLYGPAGGSSSSSSSRHMCGSPASMLRQGGGSHGRRSTGSGGNGRCRGHATDAWHLPNPLLRSRSQPTQEQCVHQHRMPASSVHYSAAAAGAAQLQQSRVAGLPGLHKQTHAYVHAYMHGNSYAIGCGTRLAQVSPLGTSSGAVSPGPVVTSSAGKQTMLRRRVHTTPAPEP